MAEEEMERMNVLLTMYVVAQIVGLLSVLLTFYWSISVNSGFGLSAQPLFNWHPLFMSIGLIYLMGNGILVFRIFRNGHKKTLKLLHAIINGTGFVFTALAAVAVIVFHNERNIPHFYTLHSWVGIITVVLYLCQAVAGFCVYFLDLVSPAKKAFLMHYHIYFGHLIFVLGILSALIGINEKAIWSLGNDYAKRVSAGWLMNSIGLLLIIFGALIIFMTSNPFYKRHPRAEDSELINRSAN